jgi:hypothetical protein
VITLWFFKQCAQQSASGHMLSSFTKCPSIGSQCTQWVHAGHIVKVPIKWPLGTLWKNSLVSFMILFKMYPVYAWATHWEFFQKVSSDVATKYSTIHSLISLRVCCEIQPNWEFIVNTLKRTP